MLKRNCQFIKLFCLLVVWSEWSSCSATCSWHKNLNDPYTLDKANCGSNCDALPACTPTPCTPIPNPTPCTPTSKKRYCRSTRTGENDFTGFGQPDFVFPSLVVPSLDDRSYEQRNCVIGPKGMQTILDKNMWYLCTRSLYFAANANSIVTIPIPTLINQIATSTDSTLYKRPCNYRKCPSKNYKNTTKF